jgi:hypothetical protein
MLLLYKWTRWSLLVLRYIHTWVVIGRILQLSNIWLDSKFSTSKCKVLSPVYTIQVLHPSLHSSFLNSSFLIVHTIQETWIKKLERTWMEYKYILFFFQLGWNLDGDWPIRRQNPYQHQFVNVNNNNYTCCAKMAGKEETSNAGKRQSHGLMKWLKI